MKHLFSALLVLGAATAHAENFEPWQEASVELAKSEPKVIDAKWSQGISFWVTMADDGSSRDGFGEYLCMVLSDAGRPKGEFVAVTIWDNATISGDNPSQIGKAYCQ